MDIQARIGSITTQRYWFRLRKLDSSTPSSCSPLFKTFCSRGDSKEPQRMATTRKVINSQQTGIRHGQTSRSRGKVSFSQFSPNKYVSWNPRQSNYPLSEEVDPIKRAERSNLMLWTSPRFTLAVAIVIVTLLLVYTILAAVK